MTRSAGDQQSGRTTGSRLSVKGKTASSAGGAPTTAHTGFGHVSQTTKVPSEQQIVSPYVARLASLKAKYLGELQVLYDQARSDYHKHLGTKQQIEDKYAPSALALENSAQDQLNGALYSLRADLQNHGYSTDAVKVLRQQYYGQLHQTMAQFGR